MVLDIAVMVVGTTRVGLDDQPVASDREPIWVETEQKNPRSKPKLKSKRNSQADGHRYTRSEHGGKQNECEYDG